MEQAVAVTSITCNSTALGSAGNIYNSILASDTESGISIGTGSTLITDNLYVNSSNTNAIAGTGTIIYGKIFFAGSSSTIEGTLTKQAQPVYVNSLFAESINSQTIDSQSLNVQGFSISSSGVETNTDQPCFLSVTSATVSNATGDGTAVTVICDSELLDQAGNYDPTTGVFTAAESGNYQFNYGLYLNGIDASHTYALVQIVSTARTFQMANNSPFLASTGGALIYNGSVLIPMAAGNTVIFSIQVSGGTKTVNIFGDGTPYTYFSGTKLN